MVVLSLPLALTIGLALIIVDRNSLAPSNSVVSTSASKLAPKNLPNLF